MFADLKQRMAGQLLGHHLASIHGHVLHNLSPANFFGERTDKLQQQPGQLTQGFAEQRVI